MTKTNATQEEASGTLLFGANPPNQNATFAEQCAAVLSAVPSKCAELLSAKSTDLVASLDIAVYFATPYMTANVPSDVIRELSKNGIGIDLTAYPSENM